MSQHGEGEGEKIIVRVDPDLEEIVPRFLENRQEDIVAIGEALGQDDFETIRILGHSMKGAGGGYGFDAVTDLGREMEQAATDKKPEEIKRLVQELSSYMARVEVVYEE